jgi:hypothetical protein
MPTQKLNPEIITAAIQGCEAQRTRIDRQIAELRAMLPGGSTQTAATPEPAKRKRRKFSAATRRKMKASQRRRWAKVRGEAEPAPAKPKAAKKAHAAKAKPAAAKKAPAKKAAAKKTATVPAPAAEAEAPAQ